jgi:hypothetical protein
METLRQISYETYPETFRAMTTEEAMEKYLEEAFSREKLFEELSDSASNMNAYLVYGK